MKRLIKLIRGAWLMLMYFRIFDPNKKFENKTIAIVGPADSAFHKEQGDYIDSFDYVVRFNKTPCMMNDENQKYIGKKTNILFHSLYDAACPDIDLYRKMELEYLINPRNSNRGFRHILNFYKQKKKSFKIYTLPKEIYKEITRDFHHYNPTMGYCGLHCVLNSNFKHCFITGFTFYQTGYGKGYIDDFVPGEDYFQFLKTFVSPHDPRLEYEFFKLLLKQNIGKSIEFDEYLQMVLFGNK